MGEKNKGDKKKDKLPDGERWLVILGRESLKGRSTGHQIDGEDIPVERFNELCDAPVRRVMEVIEGLKHDDPKRAELIGAMQEAFDDRYYREDRLERGVGSLTLGVEYAGATG